MGPVELTGRRAECGVLDQLIGAVRAGESRALVLHGEAGVGKTALLEYVAAGADGCRLARASGVQSEMELPFAGLHQLCAPVLDRVDRLPPPQQEALRVVFGLSQGAPPDLFLIGLAVLSLLSEAAVRQPLVCLVDDQQWLDRSSAQILAFVARRLGAEAVALIFATREVGDLLDGVPEFPIGGLNDTDARTLLNAVLSGPIDQQVRNQLVADAHGNPLALLELPRGLTPAQLAGGFGLPGAGTVEETFVRRVAAVPPQTRQLLLLVAADPSGDAALVRRAAARLGISPDAALAAREAGLTESKPKPRFRHPLVRSAVYRSASDAERRLVHAALAAETDAQIDPDRRAWHRAQAASGPDPDIADELEQSAGRARARGGLSAAAAFLHRAVTLTVDPAQRAERALAAAQTELQSGGFPATGELLELAEREPLTERQRARADLIRAQLAFATSRGSDAPQLMLQAAKRLEPIDVDLARTTYLDAISAATFATRLATSAGDLSAVARAAAAAPRPNGARPGDLLLDGTAAAFTDGYAAGMPALRKALAEFGAGMSMEQELQLLWMATTTAMRLWDVERWQQLSDRHIHLAREVGVVNDLALALAGRAYVELFTGNLGTAAALTAEAESVNEVTGGNVTPYGLLGVAALSGNRFETERLVAATTRDAIQRGEGIGITIAEWAAAVLDNSLGRYQEAASTASRAFEHPGDHAVYVWTPAELAEAGARSGQTELAELACRRLDEMADAGGTDWIRSVRARSRALLAEGNEAEAGYREAIGRLDGTSLRVDLARAQLVHGEWLRRERRRLEAREQLRAAHTSFESMGMAAFAERARRELKAAGGTARKRVVPAQSELTAQEAQIARMARDGLSNPEIGTRLFISARTVQYHLRKVFTKLGITSRSQLPQVLP
ncbi:regulatory LuxR family protein [Kribbella rubisoli]|uniref:Regulatory LuxR family protein n=1 Tax=Kribbella rubisoli TaxID=3075929 RepID=A0A4Q7VYM8_9ACTN|nr:LuxR family transcriptional regulator [Kribbella rubisoli]RZU01884.1 regulatory LuxR family protein [Kribbella rubisoli]